MVIQRSWKILSETASASSTDANRSPAGFHYSSEDSNCSNQTTHSMVTGVASPPATKMDCVNVSVDTMKFATTPQMAETLLKRLRQRIKCPVSGTNPNSECARSLELLRITIQSSFDKEIDVIVKRFIDNYFKPACGNIKNNLGLNSIPKDVLEKMSCSLLENAKAQYNAFRPKTAVNVSVATQPIIAERTVRVALKRPAPKPMSVTDLSKKLLTTTAVQSQLVQSPNNAANRVAQQLSQTQQVHVQPQTQLVQLQPQTQLVHVQQQNQLVHVQPQTQLVQVQPQTQLVHIHPQTQLIHVQPQNQLVQVQANTVTVTPARRQIFWNTAHISTATKFVLDVQANQIFGFRVDGKERLASKHPELIRYLPDGDDRDWLVAQNIIAPQNRNARFLFLLHDEIFRLKQSHDAYRNKPNINLTTIHTFCVPAFMINKMKDFFVDLNIKSRGLITNSYSTTTTQSNSHLRNALLQGANNNTAGTEASTAIGVQITLPNPNDNATVDVQMQAKPKPSTLSSSHATLTALLNNAITSSSLLSTHEELLKNRLHK